MFRKTILLAVLLVVAVSLRSVSADTDSADTDSQLARLGRKLGVDLLAAKEGWNAIRNSHEAIAGDVALTVFSRKSQKRMTTILSFAVDDSSGTLIEAANERKSKSAIAMVYTPRRSFSLQRKNDEWILLFASDSPKSATDTISVRLSFLRVPSGFLGEPAERFLLRDGFSVLKAGDAEFNGVPSVRIDLKWKGLHPVGNRPCEVSGFLVMVPEWNWMIVQSRKTIEMAGREPVCVEHIIECDSEASTKDVFMIKKLQTRWIWGKDAASKMDQDAPPDMTQEFRFQRLVRLRKGGVDASLRQFGIPDLDYGSSDNRTRDDGSKQHGRLNHQDGRRDGPVIGRTATRLQIAVGTIGLATLLALIGKWRCGGRTDGGR